MQLDMTHDVQLPLMIIIATALKIIWDHIVKSKSFGPVRIKAELIFCAEILTHSRQNGGIPLLHFILCIVPMNGLLLLLLV